VALLQRRVLSWDYWEMYDTKGLAGDAAERLTRPPQTFSSAEVFIRYIILSDVILRIPTVLRHSNGTAARRHGAAARWSRHHALLLRCCLADEYCSSYGLRMQRRTLPQDPCRST